MPDRTAVPSAPSPLPSRRARAFGFGLAIAAAIATFTSAGTAEARRPRRQPDVVRKGGQWGVMLGGSMCIPGKAECSRDGIEDGGVTIDGAARPSFGMNGELGYRFNRFVFAGASYNLGFFDPTYEISNAGNYRRAFQNSIYAVIRPTLPLWRFDFGLGVGPGFSRQVFVRSRNDRDYSQGFSWVIAPSIDVFVSRRIFLGIKADLLFNAHAKTCHERGDSSSCVKTRTRDVAPVHQVIFGLHVGGTFL